MSAGDEIVTLKTGVEIPAASVIANLGYLRGILLGPRGEDLILDFYYFCRGERGKVRPENLAELVKRRDVRPKYGGSLEPDTEELKQVLLASYLETQEGIVLVNPVQPTERNREIIERTEKEGQQRLNDLLRGKWENEGPTGNKGRS